MPQTPTIDIPGDGVAEDPEIPRRLQVDIVVEGGDWPSYEDLAVIVAPVVAAVEMHPALQRHFPADACLAFADDALMRRLNGQFRAKDKATNVLSFPAPVSRGRDHSLGPDRANLGDIALGFETVASEARDQSIQLADHVRHLVLHGLLHLMGYDHEAAADADVMEALEIEILGQLGVANPYEEAAPAPVLR
jgi:probable rRNA maturation factor